MCVEDTACAAFGKAGESSSPSANGANHTSLAAGPGMPHPIGEGLKARFMLARAGVRWSLPWGWMGGVHGSGFQPSAWGLPRVPGPLAQAGMGRAFGAQECCGGAALAPGENLKKARTGGIA